MSKNKKELFRDKKTAETTLRLSVIVPVINNAGKLDLAGDFFRT
jgi:hypothetical protein